MAVYCVRSDVYRFVPPGMLQVPSRLVAAVDIGADTLTLAGHGLAAYQPFTLRAESGGTMPAPLVAGVTYYAKPLVPESEDAIQVAAAALGAAIDLTTAGGNVMLVKPLLWDDWIEESSRWLDQIVVAHAPPLLNADASVPEPIRAYTALLVAQRAVAHCGLQTKLMQDLLNRESTLAKQAEAWAKGKPIRGEKRPTTATNLSVSGAGAGIDPRGWDGETGGLP